MIDNQFNSRATYLELKEKSTSVEQKALAAAGFIKNLVMTEGSPVTGGRVLPMELSDSFCIIKIVTKNRVQKSIYPEELLVEEYRGLYLGVFPNEMKPADLCGTLDGVIGVMAETEKKVKPNVGFSIDPINLKLRGLIQRVNQNVWQATTTRNRNTSLNGGNELLVESVRDICSSLGVS